MNSNKFCVRRNGWNQQAEILQDGSSSICAALTPAVAPVMLPHVLCVLMGSRLV